MSATTVENSLNALQSQRTEDVCPTENASPMRKAHSTCVNALSTDHGSLRINIGSYRIFTSQIERAFMGYDPSIIEVMVERINELEAKVKILEDYTDTKPKKTRPMIRVRN